MAWAAASLVCGAAITEPEWAEGSLYVACIDEDVASSQASNVQRNYQQSQFTLQQQA